MKLALSEKDEGNNEAETTRERGQISRRPEARDSRGDQRTDRQHMPIETRETAQHAPDV